MNGGVAPAREGKDSSRDCLVFETYLEACPRLRAAGLAAPVVFLSSNTKDHASEGGATRDPVGAELAGLGVIYAPGIGAAKHSLGL